MSTPSSSSVAEPSPSSNLNLHEEGSEVREGDALQAMLDLAGDDGVNNGGTPSSVTMIGYMGREGNVHTGWSQLSGSIPVELGQSLPKLEMLLLLNNSLTGVIPSSIGNLSSLTLLSLTLNNLQGIIPEELGRLSKLTTFGVSENWLNGSIPPVLFNISSLIFFSVAGNQLHGTLPPSLGAKLPKLTTLFLGVNKLSGTIPASLANASMLQMIDLPENKFSGTVPPVFGGMNDLFSLGLGRNQFQASDAKDMSFIDSLVNCSKLQVFSIAYNDLGGKRPVDERFKDGMTMRKFVEICASSHDRIMEVIDLSMFSQEDDDDIEHRDISALRKKIECLVSVVALGLACSVESPNERLGMNDVAAQMHAVRDKLVEFGVHGVKQEVFPQSSPLPDGYR
ncbi:hypothetical protein J5N97_006330 [Dioscorea zingiberensis]|uniref:Uncharacterized protein n=1 Tax=Dioscorea zingiberensis TaxID=325984 RepID=A0A9D5DAQ1_9LILI|nr:hypothetical protein J5N97_006330 [Dioscorea zingiberensis]